ncbi:ankyrin repeat-containing protein BDA1-like [Pistacia vera]|uniref:ankyrin repeat-containing protein BDA1-like n=1 Tax=Pistacia vera TaxID=55513 RepID=UPI001262F9CF|nr:ankyrin repeat-containing protein BDA1-like [Pistacia vera]
MRGCAATLSTLIQNDSFILHKISLTAFAETPLHISALLGHVEFSKALVNQRPQLVTELDTFKRSPLHLASAEGHTEVVKELLQANKNMCLLADQEGRIPLHLAAMRGRVEVIQELISAIPKSVFEKLHGETVLHLCVRYNHLDALKQLAASGDDKEFLNSKNLEGNTVLQVSAMLKQLETTSYLLSMPKIRVDVNSLIKNDFEAFDGSSTNGTPLNNIQKILFTETMTKVQSTQSVTKVQSTQSPKKSKASLRKEAQALAAPSLTFKYWKKLLKYKSEYFEKTRGNLMVVATLIAGMSFQVATNPPGGYWQNDTTNEKDQSCPKGKTCTAGTSVHA